MSVGVVSLVNQAYCRGEETVLVARSFGPDGPQPPARGECDRGGWDQKKWQRVYTLRLLVTQVSAN